MAEAEMTNLDLNDRETKIQELKSRANELFKNEKYNDAIELYFLPSNSIPPTPSSLLTVPLPISV